MSSGYAILDIQREIERSDDIMTSENKDRDKVRRVLGIYTKLKEGHLVNKSEEAEDYGVNERSIQRDIDDIRAYLENDMENGYIDSVTYDRNEKGYRLKRQGRSPLSNSEILAVCKILLDSRAFTRGEMEQILRKLVSCCVPETEQRLVRDLIRNEMFHYVEPRHGVVFMDKMWDIGQAVREHRYIEMEYERSRDKKLVERKVQPVAIMFSEYYFYLTAFIDDEKVREHFDVINDSFPTIYRIDRIKRLKVLDERFHIPYRDRFEEGEFRKRIQFMYGGKLQRVTFRYSGSDIDAVLDRLPTAEGSLEDDGTYTVRAEVFGKGIDMWLRSQGDNISEVDIR